MQNGDRQGQEIWISPPLKKYMYTISAKVHKLLSINIENTSTATQKNKLFLRKKKNL